MVSRRITALLAPALTAAALTTGVLGPAAPASAASRTPSPKAAACDKAPWEAKVQGQPAHFGAGSPSGDYLWHDRHGFHLRVTHARHDRRVYRGVITSSAPMKFDRVRLEKGDRVALSHNRRTLAFSFANRGYIDGVNFHTYCAARLTVSHLLVGGSRLGAADVYLGATKVHPAAVPFAVHRVAAA
jgi:hypothetical protein